MKFHIHCPACERDFNFIRIINKFYILKPRCPFCYSKLQVLNVGIYNFFLMMLFGAIGVLYMQRQTSLGEPINFFIPIGAVVIYEILAGLLICNKGKIIIKENRFIREENKELGK